MPISMTWQGLDEFVLAMQAKAAAMPQAAATALYMEGEETIAAAKPLTPVLHGNLRASGFVNLPVLEANGASVTFGFGGVAGTGNQAGDSNTEDVGYAVPVHEDLTAHHTTGQAKFLEQPFEQRQSDMAERLAGRISANLP